MKELTDFGQGFFVGLSFGIIIGLIIAIFLT